MEYKFPRLSWLQAALPVSLFAVVLGYLGSVSALRDKILTLPLQCCEYSGLCITLMGGHSKHAEIFQGFTRAFLAPAYFSRVDFVFNPGFSRVVLL